MTNQKYTKHVTKNGRIWLVPDKENAGDGIHVGFDYNTKSDGYGGRELTFELVDGGYITLHGPWLTTSEPLYRATGIDVRDKHRTKVIVAGWQDYKDNVWNPTFHKQVESLSDVDWVISDFPRKDEYERTQALADAENKPLIFHKKSDGGSSTHWLWPTGTTHKDWKRNETEQRMEQIK